MNPLPKENIMTKTDEIRSAMLEELTNHGIIDPTPDQQVSFLEGLRAAWREDADENPVKREYQRAVQDEIERLWPETTRP
jgi:hypothetical protein